MRFANGQATILALFLAATGFQAPAIAATFNVSDATGLRSALFTAATNGEDDVIVLAAGTYSTGGTTFTFLTNENNSLTLQGASGTTRSQVVLDGGGTSQVLKFSCVGSCGAITLQGLTVQNGNLTGNAAGGGINASTTLTVSDVSFSGNNAASGSGGGAIFAKGAVTVTNSIFSNNTAGFGGGAIDGGGDVTVTNSSFSNNTAGSDGGAIYANGPVTVTSSAFSNNTSTTGGGGAIFIYIGTVTVTNSTFSNNTAGSNGGAIYERGGTVTNSSFSNNSARLGGGAIYGGGDVTVTNSSFTNNTAATSCCFYYPRPTGGGAINGFRAVINSTFSNNTTGSDGGAIVGNGTVINSLFNNNTTTSVLITVEPFTNTTQVVMGCGGAINGGGISVNNTFSGNVTIGLGAAICGAQSIINSVFYGHSTPAIAATAYNLYYNLIDTSTGISGGIPIMVGNVAPGATSPFVDAANGNFQLAAGSLAIDAGLDPNSTTFANLVGFSLADIRQVLLTDLQGYQRPAPGTAVDIGAYEFGSMLPTSPVYRFFNTIAGGHFFTISEAEKNTVIQNYPWFRFEQTGFYAYPVLQPGTLPVYRFFNTIAGGHFFTISEEEKNTVIQNYPWFRYEQTGFYAYAVQHPGALPVYRFFNTIAGGHFFTISEAERDTVIQSYPWFRYEQAGFYAYPSP